MHMGGGGMHMGGGGMHMGGTHMGGTHMGVGSTRVSGLMGRGLHRGRRFGGFSDWGGDCLPYEWGYESELPDACF
jgi:hypothetical protein